MNHEREITSEIDLCTPSGRLNPNAVGWSRRPLHRCNLRGWGRKKRWEYWAVQDEQKVLAVTVSDLDYAGLFAVWFSDPSGEEHVATGLQPVPRLSIPERAGRGEVSVRAKTLAISLQPLPEGLRLRASTPELDADVHIERSPGHPSLGVVVPWSSSRFQYTVKETAMAATGSVRLAGQEFSFAPPTAFATWDFGRGKWPYRITWNWGSGAGHVDGHRVGLQFGGAWTDGTGSTENAVFIDDTTHKISEDVEWRYEPGNWLAPWKLSTRDDAVDLLFTPKRVRTDTTELGVIGNRTHQCFGVWSGRVAAPGAPQLDVSGIPGWVEEVRNRW